MLEAAEHENGNIGRHLEYSIEGFKPVAVGKEQIDQDRGYALFSVLAQSSHGVGATLHPLDVVEPVTRIKERLCYPPGLRAIVIYQKHGLWHRTFLAHLRH